MQAHGLTSTVQCQQFTADHHQQQITQLTIAILTTIFLIMGPPTQMAVVRHHLDIMPLTVDGKVLDIMTHKDLWIVVCIKVTCQKAVEDLLMYSTGHLITIMAHQVISFMTDDHTQERLASLEMVHLHQVLCIQIFHIHGCRKQRLMNQEWSCKGHTWGTETI